MKKTIVISLIVLTSVFCLFSASLKPQREAEAFDSEVMLGSWDFNPVLDTDTDMSGYEIDLITTTKGDPVFSWFGHTGLRIVYPDRRAVIVDYGLFAYDDDFFGNFAMGRLWYGVNATYADGDLNSSDAENRTVRYVRLNLTPEKKAAIIDFVAYNVQPGNDHYLYHYYLDNCATRIRDIINYATDGEFKLWAEGKKSTTFRQEASRALCVDAFWDYLLNFLQGGRIDKPITLWDDMFLPDVLEKAVIDFGLAQEQGVLVDNTQTDSRPETLEQYSLSKTLMIPMLVSLGLCILFILFARLGMRSCYGALGFIVYLVLGLLGTLLLFMSVFTDHDVTWFNENLLFINPLLLLFACYDLRFAGKRTMPFEKLHKQDFLFFCITAVVVLLKLLLPKVFYQNNIQQIITVMPIYAIKAFVPMKRTSLRSRRKEHRSYVNMI